MQSYFLAPHVYPCVTEDHVVLLDLARDQYVGVARDQMAALAERVKGWPGLSPASTDVAEARASSSRANAMLEKLLAAGMLTTDPTNRVPHLAFQADSLSDLPILPIEEVETAYYLRMDVKDHPGVLAKIASVLSEGAINIEAIIQKDQADETAPVPLIMLTRKVQEKKMNAALDKIRKLDVLVNDITRIRVEALSQ